MDDSKPSKWDLKQVGTGVGGSVLALLLLQDRGIDLMSKNQQSMVQVAVEKTLANSNRIENLETELKGIREKIDAGFSGVRKDLRHEVDRISEIVRAEANDRYTKTEHNHYANFMDRRIEKLEKEIKELRKELTNKK